MSERGNEELQRARVALRSADGPHPDFALLSSVANVTYVSGYEVPFPIGAGAEFAYGITLALISAQDEGGSRLVASRMNAAKAEQSARLASVAVFEAFDTFQDVHPRESFIGTVRQVLIDAGLHNRDAVLGIEARTLPHAVSELLATEFPRLKLVDVEHALATARLIKTEREIGLLRQAVRVADAGQMMLAELCKTAGRTEFDMWGQICGAMFRCVGHEIPVVGELVTGPRTTTVNYPGGPWERTTVPGDAALMDISQRVDGYWSDCTNTHVIAAEPTAHQRKYAKASQEACEAAMAALRPGNRASDAALAAEAAFTRHGMPMAHYTGHQLGVTVNELPRLVHYDHTPIQPGMVFAVEPGAYEGPNGTFGARSEKIVLVTASGPEILSQFEWGIR